MNLCSQIITHKFDCLSDAEKRVVHLFLGEFALSVWNEYCRTDFQTSYYESVCGTLQNIDSSLPADALHSVRKSPCTKDVATRYQEPIAAMQDGDLNFPEPVTSAYYSIYNLFCKYVANKKVDDWLIVNQILSSLESEPERNALMESAFNTITSG